MTPEEFVRADIARRVKALEDGRSDRAWEQQEKANRASNKSANAAWASVGVAILLSLTGSADNADNSIERQVSSVVCSDQRDRVSERAAEDPDHTEDELAAYPDGRSLVSEIAFEACGPFDAAAREGLEEAAKRNSDAGGVVEQGSEVGP